MDKLSIIMPAYNEEKRIGRTLEVYSFYFESLRKDKILDYEILVVINNTTDRTEEIVREIAGKNKRIIYLNLKPGGKGFAVIEGFKDALKRDNNLIGFVDADMATLPEDFYFLVKNIGNCGGIIASRYIKGSVINPKPTFQRRITSRMFNMLVRSMFFIPYRDTQCGTKIFKRRALESILTSLSMSQWAFDVELIYNLRKKGFAVREMPTKWSDREYSKINFLKAGPWMGLAVIRLRLINSPLKDFVRFYDRMLNLYKISGNNN